METSPGRPGGFRTAPRLDIQPWHALCWGAMGFLPPSGLLRSRAIPLPGKTALLLTISASALFLFGGLLFGQDAPHWASRAQRSIPTPVGAAIVSYDIDLQPTADAATLWREYEAAKKDFEKWFEETRVWFEDRFNSTTGDAKIAAGKALINFVFEAERRYEEIKQPRSGTWTGSYSETVTLNAPLQMLDIKIVNRGEMTLRLLDEGPAAAASPVEGRVENGTVHVDFGAGPPGPMPLLQGASDSTWEGQFLGLAEAGSARIIIRVHQKDVEVAFGMLGGFGGYGRATEGRGTAFALYMDELRRIYLIKDAPFSYANTWDEPELPMIMTGRDEIFDAREYLDRYFRLYVGAIESVELEKFARQQGHAAKRDEAWRAVNLFIEASALGDAAGVDLGVMDDAGLGHQDPDSHFDEWFRKWFTEAMADWDERVNAAGGEAKVEPARGRHGFAVKTIFYADYALFSETLFQELGLLRGSALMDSTYKVYYDLAFSMWLGRVKNDRAQLSASLAWLSEQAAYAGTGFISSDLARALGLTAAPPSGEAELRRAAEGR
jgi:hypothetical protein